MVEYTLGKKERLNSKTLIELPFFQVEASLFSGFSATCGVYVGRACGGRYGGSFYFDKCSQ